ncbi:hypothetical protein K469DRAFT_716391 [Zopfia rhizophila CBS 207.26]|uniref:BZIP domain-containing protein n=1 Tax=Zopfia rhizophila CBS 207.26 TaxID=1314779 RepID=A0A6A6DP20_9PEZI|nr:hypothetical protein K469DRAFT_716391 [Zopfia rhizophila CBS 207.26]
MDSIASPFDWANSAFLVLDEANLDSALDKWPSYENLDTPAPHQSFTIPPALLSQASVERYGQITPPDELSPAEPRRDSGFRESSIPLEQLHNEALWPSDQAQSLGFSAAQSEPLSHAQETSEPALKRRRTSNVNPASQKQALATAPRPTTDNSQPQKRKRGRPKANPLPQTSPEFADDGFGGASITSTRQSHLEKNRVAAHKCRQRKKEFIHSLETRAREYTTRNRQLKESVALLREELLYLKNEVLRHADCGFWAVDEYLAKCAGDLLGREGESAFRRSLSQTHSPTMSTLLKEKEQEESSPASQTEESKEDFGGLELLKDFDDEDDE